MANRTPNLACVCGIYSFEVPVHEDVSGDKV